MKKQLLKATLLALTLFFGLKPLPSDAQPVPSYVPTNGLVAWWPFNNGSANDASGNGHHGTLSGAVPATDRFNLGNMAFSFNGSTAHIFGSSDFFPTASRTVALWFYSTDINQVPTGMQVLGYGGGSCGQSWLIQMDNPTPATSFFTNNTYEVSIGCNNWLTALPFGVNGTPANPGNNWHHWVITNGPGGIDFYFDGNYAGGTTTPVGNTLVAGKKFFLGSCPDSTGLNAYQDAYLKNWNGKLDDIGVWNRQLTQQEITALYNSVISGEEAMRGKERFKIYPSPAQNLITLESGDNLTGMDYVIYDNIGRTVFSGTISEANTSINISTFANGYYVLRTERGTAHPFHVIKP